MTTPRLALWSLAISALLACCTGGTHDHPTVDAAGDASPNDADPTADGIVVTSPVDGSHVPSPVAIDATVATCGGAAVTSLGYSIDDSTTLIASSSPTAMSVTDSSMTVGTQHTIHFKAWAGSTACPAVTSAITIVACGGSGGSGYDGSPCIPVPPSSATLYDNIDNLTSWSTATGAASSCPNGSATPTCDPPDAIFNRTVEHVADPGTSPPGSDHSAGEFELDQSKKDVTALWGHSFATIDTPKSFIWDFYVYFDAISFANAELDFYQVLGGHRLMLGTQCDRGSNSWDTWNEDSQTWSPNKEIPCQTILTAAAWHHVIMYGSTDGAADSYTYHTLRVDGVDYPLEQLKHGKSKMSTWPEGHTGVQVQIDANSSGAPVTEYVESMKTYAW
jgi:hypothetical protein